MIERSAFGMRLWRLLAHRRPTFGTSIEYMVAALAADADVPLSGLNEVVIKGAEPEPDGRCTPSAPLAAM